MNKLGSEERGRWYYPLGRFKKISPKKNWKTENKFLEKRKNPKYLEIGLTNFGANQKSPSYLVATGVFKNGREAVFSKCQKSYTLLSTNNFYMRKKINKKKFKNLRFYWRLDIEWLTSGGKI